MTATNILLIMADQFRYDAIGAHGNPAIRTPGLDRLVDSGTTFSRAYTESPVCVPARACLLTGRLPHQTGVVDNHTPLAAGTATFARDLTAAGYLTQAIGKMHFEPVRADHGFTDMALSEEIPARLADDDYLSELVDAGYGHVLEPHGVRHELYYSPQPSQLPEQLTTTAWTGRKTVEFIGARAAEPEQPWFCFTSFIKPHPPFDPPSPWYLDYDPLDMPDPVRSAAELEQADYHHAAQHRVKWTRPDESLDRIRTMRAYYYACVSFVDAQINAILDELDRHGMRENTLVVFTADHGEYLGDHWAFGKRGFHDAAARIPLVLSQPGSVPCGRTTDALVGLTDVAPTCLAAAGLRDTAVAADGTDLAPLARGEVSRLRDLHYGQYQENEQGLYFVTDGTYKYVYSAASHREQLFLVGSAHDDTVDLAADPAHATALARLRAAIVERYWADGYLAPLDGSAWRHWPPPPLPHPPDDRDAAGRGRQYPHWSTVGPHRRGGVQ